MPFKATLPININVSISIKFSWPDNEFTKIKICDIKYLAPVMSTKLLDEIATLILNFDT